MDLVQALAARMRKDPAYKVVGDCIVARSPVLKQLAMEAFKVNFPGFPTVGPRHDIKDQ